MSVLKRRSESIPVRSRVMDNGIYQKSRWHSFSKGYLKSHRLCVKCKSEGKTVLSYCTDHVVPLEEGGPMWDTENMQALCKSCHSKKTIAEQKSRGQRLGGP